MGAPVPELGATSPRGKLGARLARPAKGPGHGPVAPWPWAEAGLVT
jgi:hypothetical protein